MCLGGWVVRVLKGRGREGERGWEDGRMGGWEDSGWVSWAV